MKVNVIKLKNGTTTKVLFQGWSYKPDTLVIFENGKKEYVLHIINERK